MRSSDRLPTTPGRSADSGSVLVLGLGLVLVALLVAGVVVDASRLFLAQRTLASLADGAALRAAHDVDLAALYASRPAGALPLSGRTVLADVDAYVRAQAQANGTGQVHVVTAQVNGGTVTVTLEMDQHLPLLGTIVGQPEVTPVTATATASTWVVASP